jgi:Domain of unknown function (DUF4823)
MKKASLHSNRIGSAFRLRADDERGESRNEQRWHSLHQIYDNAGMNEGRKGKSGRIPKMKLFYIIAALGSFWMTGCVSNLKTFPGRVASKPINASAKVYVQLPGDAAFPGSGLECGNRIASVLSEHFPRVELALVAENVHQAQASAKAGGCHYLVLVQLFRWEDHATEWSGALDKIELKVQLSEPESGAIIDGILITGKSKWGTLGEDHPGDLIREPLGNWLRAKL